MRIMDAMLAGACREQRERFAAEWPDGAEVTEANVLRAFVLGLDVDWLLSHVLPAPLWAEYQRQRAPLIVAMLERGGER